jgi:hypothetical protein
MWASQGRGQTHIIVPLKTDIFSNFFGLGQCWPDFLRDRARIADSFRRNYFECVKPEFTNTVFTVFR